MNREFWQGKRVFVTGHTGFKGGWLALWLTSMGAKVYGYALAPPTSPSFFEVTGLGKRITASTIADVRDYGSLTAAMQEADPQIVLHLAAQPLVRYSYANPVETYSINVMGTVHLLECVRNLGSVKSVVNITSDKSYENREWVWPYRENESMGGHDPYSNSKGCSELVTAAYRSSFFKNKAIATARAGNVIGGGDWASDRLIPDFLRALDAQQMLVIRSPGATRPWQHVLEPLSGYLALAEKLYANDDDYDYASGWNFGSEDTDARPVKWIVEYLCGKMPGATWRLDDSQQLHEANMLRLDSSKAKAKLGWQPRWNLESALSATMEWHTAWRTGQDMAVASLQQINAYENTK